MTEPDRAGASTPGPDQSSRRGLRATLLRWRAPIVLVPLLFGLGYSGAVGAQMLWAEAAPDPVPEPVVTCWDDSASIAADCPDPAGVPGMRWVFPSFRPGSDRCTKVAYRDTRTPRPLEFTCQVRIGGGRAEISYSERSDLERGLAYFAATYDGVLPVREAGGARLVYRGTAPRPDGTYAVTVALTPYPFAVTVSAANERLRDAALDNRVRFRNDQFLTVRPPEEPGPPS